MQATPKLLLVAVTATLLCSCFNHEMSEKERKEANTPAGKAGQVAYKAAQVTEKVAKVAGKELSKAAHDAHEGWKEASQQDKTRH
jgi:hypothetical protein